MGNLWSNSENVKIIALSSRYFCKVSTAVSHLQMIYPAAPRGSEATSDRCCRKILSVNTGLSNFWADFFYPDGCSDPAKTGQLGLSWDHKSEQLNDSHIKQINKQTNKQTNKIIIMCDNRTEVVTVSLSGDIILIVVVVVVVFWFWFFLGGVSSVNILTILPLPLPLKNI